MDADACGTHWGSSEPTFGRAPAVWVDRAVLDGALRDAAVEKGVSLVRQRARTTTQQGAGARILLEDGSTVGARWVVDARGRKGTRGGRRARTSAATVAVRTDVREMTPGPYAIVESAAKGWLWIARRQDGGASLVAFIDPDRLGRAREEHGPRWADGIVGEFASATRFPRGLADSAPLVCDATPFVDGALGREGLLRVGDAAVGVDPLSSCGLFVALQTAIWAAAVVHTAHLDPSRLALGLRFFRDQVERLSARHVAHAGAFYAQETRWATEPFWQRRSLGASPVEEPRPLAPHESVRLSPHLSLNRVGCLVGDTIEETEVLVDGRTAEPCGFFGPVPLVPLLAPLSAPRRVSALLAEWSGQVGPRVAAELLTSARARGWLVTPDMAVAHVGGGFQ